MNRSTALVVLRVAGYHGDRAKWKRTYVENRIPLTKANKEWKRGTELKAAGVPWHSPAVQKGARDGRRVKTNVDADQLGLQFEPVASTDHQAEAVDLDEPLMPEPPTPVLPKYSEPLAGWESVVPEKTRCVIVTVHLPCFAKEIGRVVVIRSVSHETRTVWASDDAPVEFRTNQKGRKVVAYDPRGVRTCYSMSQLRVLA